VGRPPTGPTFASDDRPETEHFSSELLVHRDDRRELVLQRPCQLVEADASPPRLAGLGIAAAPGAQDGVEPSEPAVDRRRLASATSSSFEIHSFILVPGGSSKISGWLTV
jgi:hypothetical protein